MHGDTCNTDAIEIRVPDNGDGDWEEPGCVAAVEGYYPREAPAEGAVPAAAGTGSATSEVKSHGEAEKANAAKL
eukprot:13386549-Heterocapsa_arctica.AAC.1